MRQEEALRKEITRLAFSLLLVLLLIGIATRWVFRAVIGGYGSRIFESYIDDNPFFMFRLRFGKDRHALLQAKINEFFDEDSEREELALDAEELNYLIWTAPSLRDLVRVVRIEEGGVRAFVSVPFIRQNRLRFFNGAALLTVRFNFGVLGFSVQSMTVDDREVPLQYLTSTSQYLDEALSSAIYPDPRIGSRGVPAARKLLWQLQEIRLHEGKAVLVPLQRG